jgi:uncharacterized repeat protein (TIGR01451 family)
LLQGDYIVGGLRADVCYGVEAACVPDGSCTFGDETTCEGAGCYWSGTACELPSCDSMADAAIHPNAGASFALLLIVDDPSLAFRAITRFTGLVSMDSTVRSEMLDLDFPLSSPAAGALAFYVLEGDMGFAGGTTGANCATSEFVEVDGDAIVGSGGVCLEDDDNLYRNPFNGTINVQPGTPEVGCTTYDCCAGDGLCGVVGVDIDRFDISSALVPGVTEVRTTIGASSDRIFLAALILGVDVFEPLLAADTQVRVLSANDEGYVRIGEDLVYSIAVSNTGNVPATSVRVEMDAPAGTSKLRILTVPNLADDNSSPTGGAAGSGFVDVGSFSVPQGEVAEIRVAMELGCTPDLALSPVVRVSAIGIAPFSVDAPEVTTGGPGLGAHCPDVDLGGPFAPPVPARQLRGGGCQSSAAAPLGLLAGLVIWALRQRKRAL